MNSDEADGSFTVWSVSIAPGEERPVEPREWDDALVLIRSGDVDVQCDRGSRHTFHAGDMVALCWLRALNLANVGAERVELLAVRRSVR